jgi:hypothetical protein
MNKVNLRSNFRTMACSSSRVYSFDRDPTLLTGLTSSFSESSSLDASSRSKLPRWLPFSEEFRILRSSKVCPPPRKADIDSTSESSASLSGVVTVGAGVLGGEEEEPMSPVAVWARDIVRATTWRGKFHVHGQMTQIREETQLNQCLQVLPAVRNA